MDAVGEGNNIRDDPRSGVCYMIPNWETSNKEMALMTCTSYRRMEYV